LSSVTTCLSPSLAGSRDASTLVVPVASSCGDDGIEMRSAAAAGAGNSEEHHNNKDQVPRLGFFSSFSDSFFFVESCFQWGGRSACRVSGFPKLSYSVVIILLLFSFFLV
jgi:hypothetical protein